MDIIIKPTKLRGTITAIPSKSQAHRLLICAAFAEHETRLRCPDTNRDIEATADCLRALGAEILRDAGGYTVFPVQSLPATAVLPCHVPPLGSTFKVEWLICAFAVIRTFCTGMANAYCFLSVSYVPVHPVQW